MKVKYKLKTGYKLLLGFGIVLITIIISYISIYQMLVYNKSNSININETILPSLSKVNKLSYEILDIKQKTEDIIQQTDTSRTTIEAYDSIVKKVYPNLKRGIIILSQNWDRKIADLMDSVFINSDYLMSEQIEFSKSFEIKDSAIFIKKINKFKIRYSKGGDLYNIILKINDELEKIRTLNREILAESNTQIVESFNLFSRSITIQSVIVTFIIFIIAFITARSLTQPLIYLKDILIMMSSGALPSKKLKTSTDEAGQMGLALNELISGLKQKSEFATEIGKGNFETNLKLAGDADVLGNALIQMRESLVKASEEAELRRIENTQRSWSSQGLAEFNEIIREHSATLEKFTSVTISKLTKYLDAQIGGLYILNEEEGSKFLTLEAFYAYGRQKFIHKRIELGENLVGQSVLEKDTIYMTDIPENYVHISSGLGEDSPKSLLIVPLMMNDIIFGVVELASFNEFEDYQIEFVEKTGEILAATISNIKINIQTSKLLEDSKEKSDKLAKQEEESRQSIMDLETSNKDLKEKEKELLSRYKNLEEEYKSETNSYLKKIRLLEVDVDSHLLQHDNLMNVVNNSLSTVTTDISGKIVKTNSAFIALTGLTMSDIKDKIIDDFFVGESGSFEYMDIWKNLKAGKVHKGINKYDFKGNIKWLMETFVPTKNSNNEFDRIVMTFVDVTQFHKDK